MTVNYFDIVIVGGGPNGLFCHSQLIRRFPEKRVLLLEKGRILQSIREYPDVVWHSRMKELMFPCSLNAQIREKSHPTSSSIADYYEYFATESKVNFREFHEVFDISEDGGGRGYKVSAENNGAVFHFFCSFVILCGGVYGNFRPLAANIPASLLFRHLDITVRNERLLLVGQGASAVDAVAHLLPFNKITWVIRGQSWETTVIEGVVLDMFNRVMKRYRENLSIHFGTTVVGADDGGRFALSDGTDVAGVDRCFALLGFNSENDFLKRIGLSYQGECLDLDASFQTNKKNIHAFGSLMSLWDSDAHRPAPTYIHNGNRDKLGMIMDSIERTVRQDPPSIREVGGDEGEFGAGECPPSFDKVMIVAHPDDETLWGGNTLAACEGWLVICLTNGHNVTRRRQFDEAMDLFGVRREIWNYPEDWKEVKFLDQVTDEIESRLSPLVNSPHVTKVVTHNPDGEYGHDDHRRLSRLVTRAVKDRNRLCYFSFCENQSFPNCPEKEAALQVYFSKYLNATSLWSRGLRRMKEKIFRVPRKNHAMDRAHYALSARESVTGCSAYRQNGRLLFSVYRDVPGFVHTPVEGVVPKNAEAVYEHNPFLYERYPDRKYMVTEFLPQCQGKTLAVGCHPFNQFDCYCLPDPRQFETIDINRERESYGSPFGHTTVDFLEFSPEYRFDHVLLFGVLGIEETGEAGDLYTLFDGEEATIQKVDALLNRNGRVLFGPDIKKGRGQSSAQKASAWKRFFLTHKTIQSSYQLIKTIETQENLTLVFQKR